MLTDCSGNFQFLPGIKYLREKNCQNRILEPPLNRDFMNIYHNYQPQCWIISQYMQQF